MDYVIFQKLGIALLLGILVGLEREQKHQQSGYDGFGGIRTFALISVLGFLSYMLLSISPIITAVIGAGFLGIMLTTYFRTTEGKYMHGITSEIAAILVYMVGMLVAHGEFVLGTTISLSTVAILHFKKPLHKLAKHVKNIEIISAIQFLVIAFVVLPLLPNQAYGPYAFFNPYIVWLMVVFISALSFISYIAIKLFGAKKGIVVTGFLAGFISTTALALTFADQSKKNIKVVNPYIVAIMVSISAMFVRVAIEVAVIDPELLMDLLKPIVTMFVVSILCVVYFWVKKEKIPEHIEERLSTVKSPFSLASALKFGIFFACILFVVKAANDFFGDKGLYITSAITGLFDIDSIVVSVANLAKENVDRVIAIRAIVLASMSAVLAKALIFMFLGSRIVSRRIAVSTFIIFAAGTVSLFFI